MVFSKSSTVNRYILIVLLSILGAFNIVLPNSIQLLSAASIVVCAMYSLLLISPQDISRKYLFFIYLSSIATILYLLIGVLKSAPNEAIKQVLIIYIVSPILWFIVLTATIKYISRESLIKYLLIVTWCCCFSVLVFFYLFENYGPESVSLFKENANINTREGFSGANMHVYGSLIFLTGAFFSTPEAIKNKLILILTLSFLTLAAITSGRTALILSVIIGILVYLIIPMKSFTSLKKKIRDVSVILVVFSIVFYVAIVIRGINISYITELMLDKIYSGGGSERAYQSELLLESFFNNYTLGVGHGIGVEYIRSYSFPWRYETVWYATLHRVGILGTLVYLLPFIWYILSFFNKIKNNTLNPFDKFMFGGFICSLIASNTNPYLEGFSFQWMYILPILATLQYDKYHNSGNSRARV